MSEFQTLDYTVEDNIAIATFNRPDRMNTFNAAQMADLLALFDTTDADDAVRAVILTGSGRAFCAGADLGGGGETFDYKPGARDGDVDVDGVRRDGGGRVVLRIFASLKPVIAAVNGAAVGIGATMQLPMDWRMASTGARFGFVFARRGITPEACSGWFLPRLVGAPRALDWVYSGRVFGAQEALDAGLVQSLHEPGDLLAAAKARAHEMTDKSAPVSVALARQMMWQGLGMAHPMDMHRIDSRAIQARGKSADVREGIASFQEKRDPHFPDTVSGNMPEFFPWAAEPDFR